MAQVVLLLLMCWAMVCALPFVFMYGVVVLGHALAWAYEFGFPALIVGLLRFFEWVGLTTLRLLDFTTSTARHAQRWLRVRTAALRFRLRIRRSYKRVDRLFAEAETQLHELATVEDIEWEWL
jgi:hypothetical protein